MQRTILFVLFSTILVCSNALAGAGHDHEHNHEAAVEAAPHGGMLRDSPPYKTELVLNKDRATIHIYNKDLAVIGKDKLKSSATGELAFPKDKTKREVVFKLVGDTYQADIPGISAVHRFDFHVTLVVEGKEIIGDFGVDNIH